MRRIDMKVLLPILGLGALAFALGSSKKAPAASAQPVTKANGTGAVRVSASDIAGYPADEGTGDVSSAPVPRLRNVSNVKLNGGAS